MLTARQRQLLDFIRSYMAASAGVAPSQEEMALAVGLRAKGNINRQLGILEERGFIRRRPYRARAIEVVEPLPADTAQALGTVLVEARGLLGQADTATPVARQRCIARIDALMERLENRGC